MTVQDVVVGYLPPGYTKYGELSGRRVTAFSRDHEEQRMFACAVATQATQESLLVFVAENTPDPRPPLIGTEKRGGGAMPAPGGGEFEYHDGMWAAGSDGDTEVRGIRIKWDRTRVHSVTLYRGKRAVAVRAPLEVTPEDLLAVALSVTWP